MTFTIAQKNRDMLKNKLDMLDGAAAIEALEFINHLAATHSIAWALCGGLAMAFYGSPRLTKDVDIVAAHRLPVPPSAVRGYLKQGGEHFMVETERQAVKTDWILRSDHFRPLYQDALASARVMDGVPIVSPEHLVLMKYIAGRFKDQEDAVFLLRQPHLVHRRTIKEIVVRVLGAGAWIGFHVGLSRWFDLADRFVRDGDENESYRTEAEYLTDAS